MCFVTLSLFFSIHSYFITKLGLNTDQEPKKLSHLISKFSQNVPTSVQTSDPKASYLEDSTFHSQILCLYYFFVLCSQNKQTISQEYVVNRTSGFGSCSLGVFTASGPGLKPNWTYQLTIASSSMARAGFLPITPFPCWALVLPWSYVCSIHMCNCPAVSRRCSTVAIPLPLALSLFLLPFLTVTPETLEGGVSYTWPF